MKVIRRFLVLLPGILFVMTINAQEKYMINGKVTDAVSGEILPGAAIYIKGTSYGTVANKVGFYSLSLPKGNWSITYSYISYENIEKEINLAANIRLNINLSPSQTRLDEVVVIAEKEKIIRVNPDAVSAVSISPKLIEKLPNFGEVDIMRAFQLLPGISGSNETSAGLYVRGGTPDQNLILFDGMTIYHVDHFYGFFSAFNANSIDDVELHKGGFPAEFGGRTSSVLDIKGKPADMQELNLGAGLSLLSANLFAEIPIIKDKLSIQTSFRRSYTDIIQTGLYNSIFDMYNDAEEANTASIKGRGRAGKLTQNIQPAFYFYDLNTKLSFKPTKKDLFTVSLYSGKDNLDKSREESKGDENTILILGHQKQA